MIRFDAMVASAVLFGLCFSGWSYQPKATADIRTLSYTEASTLIGGDGGWGKECKLVADCLFTYDIPCHDIEGVSEGHTSMICTQSFEYDPNFEAGILECRPSMFEFLFCTEVGSNWCNIEYICRWNSETKVCYRGPWVGKISAPADCDAEPGFPPE